MFFYIIIGFIWALGYTVFRVLGGKTVNFELAMLILFNFVLWPVSALMTVASILKKIQ